MRRCRIIDSSFLADLADTATCEFLLDYEDEEDDESPADEARRGCGGNKPWRYR